MKKKQLTVLLLAFVLVLGMLTGCGSSAKSESAYDGAYNSYAAVEEAADYYMAEPPQSAAGSSGSTAQSLPQNRKWVITMDIDAETEDLDASLGAINEQIAALNGYIESQRINNDTGSSRRYRSASLTVRIPADRVDEFVQVLNSCTNVLSNARDVKDITLAYTDTEGRINALKTEEARLLELMAQAEDMSDLLVIEQRLTEVRYELESYSSQLRRYDNQVDYATVSLYISQVQQYTPVEKQTVFQRITKGFKQSLEDVGEGIVDFIVWLIVDLPYLVIWGLVIWAVVAVFKAVRKRRKTAAPKEKKPLPFGKWKKKQEQKEE